MSTKNVTFVIYVFWKLECISNMTLSCIMKNCCQIGKLEKLLKNDNWSFFSYLSSNGSHKFLTYRNATISWIYLQKISSNLYETSIVFNSNCVCLTSSCNIEKIGVFRIDVLRKGSNKILSSAISTFSCFDTMTAVCLFLEQKNDDHIWKSGICRFHLQL